MGLSEAVIVGDRSRRWDARSIPGCCFWIHADAYVWNGSNVTSILDQSGLRNDLYQANTARMFDAEPAPTSFFGGRRTFNFPSTKDKWYGRTGGISGFPYGQTPYTFIVVCSRSAITDLNGDNQTLAWWRGPAAPNGYLAFKSASNLLETFPGTQFTDTVECVPADVPYIWSIAYNNQSAYNFQNNIPRRSSDAVGAFGSPTAPIIRFGCSDESNPGPGANASGNYVGNIAEIIIYSRLLTPEERADIHSHLGGYYDIPVVRGGGGVIG